jgi:hypothetical protein
MGSPAKPSRAQYTDLEKIGRRMEMPLPSGVSQNGRKIVLRIRLPRQAVSLVELELRR